MRTCTVMHWTNGTDTTYIVMQGPYRRGVFHSDKATIVGNYRVKSNAANYKAMTAAGATRNAPAVPWQA